MNDKVYGEDREYGNDGERRVEDRLTRLFGPLQSLSADDKYSEFDFKNDHVYVEVSSSQLHMILKHLQNRPLSRE